MGSGHGLVVPYNAVVRLRYEYCVKYLNQAFQGVYAAKMDEIGGEGG